MLRWMYGDSSVFCARVDLEALHDPRVDRADHECRDDQQRGADQRQAPAPDDGGHDEQHGDEDRDAGEDRPPGMVALTSVYAAPVMMVADVGVRQRRILVEPDADALQQQVDAPR